MKNPLKNNCLLTYYDTLFIRQALLMDKHLFTKHLTLKAWDYNLAMNTMLYKLKH